MSVPDVVLIIGAIGALVTTVTAAIVSLQRIEKVHKIVNQQRTDMLAYQKTLVDALKAQGIHVPADKSLLKE